MEYKIDSICNDLGIGKSTLYKRMDCLKKTIPETDWKRNEYFYYNDKNKLFFTEKGFSYIKDFNTKKYNYRQNSQNEVAIYQNQIIEIYKKRIEYLENENKRLLDIISIKEQKEIAKDIKYIDGKDSVSFWNKLFNKFKG